MVNFTLVANLLAARNQRHFWLKTMTVITGLFAIALGSIVMLGWYTHNLSLVQVSPDFVPMQFNTALAFLLSGVAFIAVIFQRCWLARFVAAIVAIIGVLTLLEIICGFDLGIDQLLMDHYVTINTAQPGRMGPNTALCFSIIGVSLFVMACIRKNRWMPVLTGVSGAVLLGLSLVALTGYLLGIEPAYGWGAMTRMAVHTSVGFVVLSLGFLTLAIHQGSIRKEDLVNYLPAPIAIVVLTISILLWQALHASAEVGTNYHETLLDLILVFGGLLAIALAWAMNRTHAVTIEARATQAARVALEQDIINRRQAEDALRESEERFRSIFENAAIGIAQISIEGKYLQINDAFCRILGYSHKEIIEQDVTFEQLTYPEDLEFDLIQLKALLDGGAESYRMEKRYIRKDGEIAWVQLSVFLLRDAEKKPLYFISAGQDITQQKTLLLEVERQARVDYLTGLYNRRYFMEEGEVELARAVRYKKPLSVLMLDIDYFKRINDTYGHKTGDIVLQKISQTCTETLREVDIIGRLGGEEFAILLPETKLEMAMDVAERLRQIIESNDIALENGLPLHVTVSIGVATLKKRDTNIDTLLHKADEALYEAKNNGRNKVCI